MIDIKGFRENVGIILANSEGQILWARRIGQNIWQFPQGGVKKGESLEDCLYRELYEEIGLTSEQVAVLSYTKDWLYYRLPKHLIRKTKIPVCIGQKQKWFLLKLLIDDKNIALRKTVEPEFDDWRWVSYWYPLRKIVTFKKEVYRSALTELSPSVCHLQEKA